MFVSQFISLPQFFYLSPSTRHPFPSTIPDPLILFAGAGISFPTMHPTTAPRPFIYVLPSVRPSFFLELARICWIGGESGRNILSATSPLHYSYGHEGCDGAAARLAGCLDDEILFLVLLRPSSWASSMVAALVLPKSATGAASHAVAGAVLRPSHQQSSPPHSPSPLGASNRTGGTGIDAPHCLLSHIFPVAATVESHVVLSTDLLVWSLSTASNP